MRPVLTALALALALALGSSLPAPARAAAQAPAAGPHPVVPAAAATTPAAGAAASTAAAYDVELVIFRIAASRGTPEDWAVQAPQAPVAAPASSAPGAGADDAAATPATDATPNDRFLRPLDSGEMQLNDVVSRLRANGGYPLVAHVGWVQNASPWGHRQPLNLRQLGVDVPDLTGSVTLERGEYLHLGLALDLAVANPPAGLSAPPGTVFTLHDSHRVKLNERNYYDSPAFGVIALVSPAQRAAK